ncbi:hypothetical protein SDC9_43865 [bioreactor metagenome]|uniref:Uncharacterized protein n=1 Tax=bioreactor metagenome TaxID=1076179 RepID=A0A644W5I5_9ZZZZ
MANRFLIVCGGTGYKLLGQRSILGIDAELQIDVSKENVSTDWKVRDQRSLYVDLDQRVGTTAVAFNSMLRELESEVDSDKKSAAKKEDLKTVKMLVEQFPAARTLEYGLSQSPAVGKAAISHEFNRETLANNLRSMVTEFGTNIGPENPIEVWITSSTAGGTGEGTHRFVASVLAEVSSIYEDTPLTINFIRIGQLTYRSVNNNKTAMNTFFGIAADSAFMLRINKQNKQTVTNWFYVDLPDVGKGDTAKPIRGEIVEMACKSIMLPELQDNIQKLLVNNLGAPIVLVRTGYWGKDFGNQQKYFETLKQLVTKLQEFVDPNYERVYIADKPQPEFISPDTEDVVADAQNTKYVFTRIEKTNWSFPVYHFNGVPKSIDAIRILISDWKKSLLTLVDRDSDHFKVEFRVDEENDRGNGARQSIPLMVYETIDENNDWFSNIADTHRVKGWSRQLLGMDFKDGSIKGNGMILDLLKLADQLSKIFHQFDPMSNSGKRAEKTAGILGTFYRLLVEVNFLLDLERSATRLLDKELSESRNVLKKAIEELDIIKSTMNTSPTTMIYAANLSDVLDLLTQKTWLRLLRDAVKKGDLNLFRQEVLRGATGLTEEGLKYVLGLQANEDIVDIQNALATKVGKMIDGNGQEYEGVFWQATPPNPSLQYYYRILPQVNRKLLEQLKDRAEKDNISYRYVFTKFGTIGLYVLAFHGISLTKRDGDTTTAPAFLMRPFIQLMRQKLADWPENPKPNTSSGQLEICTAGPIGEPLYERAMLEAGLTPAELAKIGEYFELVN